MIQNVSSYSISSISNKSYLNFRTKNQNIHVHLWPFLVICTMYVFSFHMSIDDQITVDTDWRKDVCCERGHFVL